MALTLNAEQKSIYDIFSGENQYIIPPYQRAYSWTQTHCKTLFEDIKKAFYNEEQEGYFLGNIVLAKSREKRNKLEVIDGQQRLTTLILLIKVLLSFDKENKALYNAIWIKDRRTDEEIQRLETDIFMEQDFNYFREVLAFGFSTDICESINKKDNLFKKNICYFYNKLLDFSKHNDVSKFSDFLLDRVYLLPIETEDSNADKARKNALQIFETINNRGLNLSTSDIFKAELYSKALNELKHKEFMKNWKKLQKRCDKSHYTIDRIFNIYLYIIRGNKGIISKREGLREFFFENSNSPFLNKKYDEIMNDLLKISDSVKLYIDICIHPKKYQNFSKWFQIISLFEDNRLDMVVIIYIYKNNLNLNSDLIDFSLNFIRYCFENKEEEFYYEHNTYVIDEHEMIQSIDSLIVDIMHNKKLIFYRKNTISPDIYGIEVALSFYLNSKQEAIPIIDLKELMFEGIDDTAESLNKKNKKKKKILKKFFRNPNGH